MKSLCALLLVFTLTTNSFSQGTCNTAIPLIIDGVSRTYPFTSTLEPSIANCADGLPPYNAPYAGNGRVIYFQFTTGAGQPVPCFSTEVSIDGTAVLEGVLSSADCASPYGPYYQVVCFNDGNGYWAPNDRNTYGDFDLDPNTTYILKFRVGAGFNGNLTVTATYTEPDNISCKKAIPLTTTPTWYQNSCHYGDTIPAGDVCAQSLENTAWYSYTVQGNEEDLLNVSAINCDNYASDFFGYQLGIFTGTCDDLQSYGPCFKGEGGSLQFPLDGLPVGTVLYIAIDGNGSSNCRYLIWVGGGVPLPAKWGYLSGVALTNGNQVKWSTKEEVNTSHFEIQRSDDGSIFRTVGTMPAAGSAPRGKEYSFLDNTSQNVSYYRIKLEDLDHKISYSNILKVERKNIQQLQVLMQNPVNDMLTITYDSKVNAQGSISVINNLGQVVFRQAYTLRQGQQTFVRPLPQLSRGMYYLVSEFGELRDTKPFVKQ